MFERWRTFELTPDGYRETVNGIGDTLRKLGVSDRSIFIPCSFPDARRFATK